MPVDIDGAPVSFNQGLGNEDVEKRIEHYFTPYHAAVDAMMDQALAERPVHLVSIHSFTPVYLGHKRPMEVGVLFAEHDELAWHVESVLGDIGIESALNEPYSGQGEGALIYSAQSHGRKAGVPYIELEIRQDLISTPAGVASITKKLAQALVHFVPGAD